MKKFATLALAASLATIAVLPVAVRADEGSHAVGVSAGKMLYSANGQRIAAIYRVTEGGTVQVILEGRMVNVVASSLSVAGGKIVTSLTKAELLHAR
jgi:hypothetical protein